MGKKKKCNVKKWKRKSNYNWRKPPWKRNGNCDWNEKDLPKATEGKMNITKKFQSFVPEWKIRLNKRKKDKKDKKDKKESKEKEELQELKMKEINSFVVENAGLPDYNEAEEEEEEEEIKAVSDPVA